jgi:maleate isomerase
MRSDSALGWLADARAASGPVRHVGVLVPWANTVVEEELPAYARGSAVFHYARLVPADGSTALGEGFLRGLRDAVPAALAQLERIALDAVVMACTSAGFTAPGQPLVASSFDALCTVLSRHGVARIALATPYPHPTTDCEADAFAAAGIKVAGRASLALDDDYARVTPGEIKRLLDQIDPDAFADADALVLSCTGWSTRAQIDECEQALGIPVLSSNLATAIYALTAAGER